MKTIIIPLLALLGVFGHAMPAVGQPSNVGPLATAVEAAQNRYNRSFAGSPLLYNGPEYVDYALRYPVRTGHQFFTTAEKLPGSVYYNDHYFPNLRLAYDVVLDQVVLPQPTSPLNLRLINEQMQYFLIDGHRFVRLLADSSAGGVIKTGYYEMMVEDNRVQLLAKRSKRIQEQPAQGTLNAEFVAVDRLFLKKAGIYYPVNSKSGLLRLLANHKKELQQHIKDKNLRFGATSFDASVAHLVLYYCSLSPQ